MKVNVEISAEYTQTHAVIYTDGVTADVQRAIEILENDISNCESPITAQSGEKIVILKPKEVFMIRIEGGEAVIYDEKDKYYSRKRLYEFTAQLGNGFMQISKTTLVNLSYLDSVETGFSGTLLLKLKNGCKDYVSRKYLPAFKKYLGM